MGLESKPQQQRRPIGLTGFRSGYFAGYAVRSDQGWFCVFSIGISWSKHFCRTADEARTCLKCMAHALDLRWYTDPAELKADIDKLPEHTKPSIQPETLMERSEMRLRLSPSTFASLIRR
jgi:RNase adaptor protein for sRNA GlmZ degradation